MTTARRLVEDWMERFVSDDSIKFDDLLFLIAMAKQQGWISRIPENLRDISHQTILRLVPNLSFHKRADLAWAVSVLEGSIPVEKFFMLSDFLPYQYHSTSLEQAPRQDAYRLTQIYDACMASSGTVQEMVMDILVPLSSDRHVSCPVNAAHSLWWRAMSGGRLDSLGVNFMLICMNKSDTLSDRDRWISRNALRYLKPAPELDERSRSQWEFCLKNDILGRPKRSSVSWRNSSQVADSFSFR
jgi:hypothetical protein